MLNKDEMKIMVNMAQAFAEPINFDELITNGAIIKKGRSYYIKNMELLSENISKRIKTITPTKNGAKVIFYKESKSLKKFAEKHSNYLK